MSSSRLALTLFGPFEARYNDHPLAFATDKIRALLAYLVLEPDKPHRRETLAALLWPDYPDEIALRNLRQAVYRLRQTLQDADPTLPARLLTQTRPTLTLHTDATTTDTARFATLLHDAKTAPDPRPLLEELSNLYRGELLQGFSLPDAYAFDEWLTIEREVFHQQALDAFTRLLSLQTDPDAILATAPHLLALAPWHEETHRQIMRAHLQKGHRTLALAQYRDLRAILLRDLGVEPSPLTNTLLAQIQTEAPPQKPAALTSVAPQSPLHHFPTPLTPLIGRKPELDHVTQTLTDPACRLLTLTGPGGMGKTRLAIETARRLAGNPRFPDGLFFVPLTQIEHGDLLVSTLSQSLDMSFPQNADPRQEMLSRLKDRQTLLVLDNFEHLLPARADDPLSPALALLGEILSAAPGVIALVTSREPLALTGEWTFPLDGLPYKPDQDADSDPLAHPAPQLFIQAARRYRPSFTPAEHPAAILELCRLTGGMPLALEMAAAWMRAYTCEEVVTRIAQSLDFLTNPARDAPARQRSIRAVFSSTWEQLAPEQRQALAAMSVFRGGFTVQAALDVAHTTVLDLAILVEKAFIRRESEVASNGRYEMHELVRQFAAEKLAEMGEEAVRARHADFYLTWLEEQGAALLGGAPHEGLAAIRRELDNVRQGWGWLMTGNQHARVVRVAPAWEDFFRLGGLIREGEGVFRRAVEWAEQTDARGEDLAALLLHLASVLSFEGQSALAHPLTVQALTLANGERFLTGRAKYILGQWHYFKGDYAQAIAIRREALALFEQVGARRQEAFTLNGIAHDHWQIGDFASSRAFYEQALAIYTQVGDRFGAAQTAGSLGLVHLKQGEFAEARACFQAELEMAREMDNPVTMAKALNNLGVAFHDQGRTAEALQMFEEAAEIDRRLGVKLGRAKRLTNMGLMYWKLGVYDRALQMELEALAIFEELKHQEGLALNLGNIGLVYWHRGEYATAEGWIRRALAMDEERGNKEGIARHLSNLGGIYKDQEAFDRAQTCLELAHEIQREANLRYPHSETLLRLTEVHLARGELAQAEARRREGLELASAIKRLDSIFWAGELGARLAAARGEREFARAQLEGLLTEATEEEQLARVYFYLWQVTGEEGFREAARERYTALLEEVPKAEFRKRVETLIQGHEEAKDEKI
ncbi:MAG: tetratricopeptide repeat protein [Anaerolineales bacterium]|nr:tetratricopeptide repeat protein [Anaerolineales bacterium]